VQQPPQNRYFEFRELLLDGDFGVPIQVLNQEVRSAQLSVWKPRPGASIQSPPAAPAARASSAAGTARNDNE
jgi:hypothetical protein